jgi:hypothetical protein
MEQFYHLFNDMGLGTKENPANFFIQGGYFESNYGVDEFSENSLIAAIKLGKIIEESCEQNEVHYGILVNNIEQTCDGPVCIVNDKSEKNKIVDEDKEISNLIKKLKLDSYQFTITQEINLKNIGLRAIKKILKKEVADKKFSLLHNKKGDLAKWYMSSKIGNDILLFEKYEARFIAKCPIIMGTYYAQMLKKIQKDSSKVCNSMVVIDFCSFNDKDKVVRGAEVALRLFNEEFDNIKFYYVMPVLCDLTCEKLILNKFSLDQFNP